MTYEFAMMARTCTSNLRVVLTPQFFLQGLLEEIPQKLMDLDFGPKRIVQKYYIRFTYKSVFPSIFIQMIDKTSLKDTYRYIHFRGLDK